MAYNSFRNGLLITGGAAAALLLGACGAGQAGAGDSAGGGDPTSPSPTTVAQEQAQPRQTSTAQAASDAECKVADLKLGLSEPEGTAGTSYRYLVFTNKGDRTCTIVGFPGVSYVTGDDGKQVGEAAQRIGELKPAVTLKPGDSANVSIGFRDIDVFDEASCQPTRTRGLRIYPPDEYDSMFVPVEGRGCAGKSIPERQLSVTSMEPGAKPA